jgi:hypothetical protein
MLIFLPTISAGCRKNAIEVRHRPELPINEQWTALEADDDAVLDEWWKSLQDPMLQQRDLKLPLPKLELPAPISFLLSGLDGVPRARDKTSSAFQFRELKKEKFSAGRLKAQAYLLMLPGNRTCGGGFQLGKLLP